MILTTERLNFCFLELTDLGAVHEMHLIPEVDQYNTLGIPANIEVSREVVSNLIKGNESKPLKNFTWRIELKKSKQFIGLFGLKLGSEKYRRAEIWYKLHPDYWSKGYATEAVNRMLNFAFKDLDLHRVEAGSAVDNIGSIRVLEKAGMKREGRMREILPLKSGWSDNYEFAILESDPRPDFRSD